VKTVFAYDTQGKTVCQEQIFAYYEIIESSNPYFCSLCLIYYDIKKTISS